MGNRIICRKVDSSNWEHKLQKCLSKSQEMGWLSTLNDHLVIKPNLCNIVSHEAGATTDVHTVELMIKFFRNLFPGLRISIIESDNFERDTSDVFKRLGYEELATKYNINLINLTEQKAFEVIVNDIPYTINLPKLFLSDFFFISIALPKTHAYQKITAIYKNQFGCIPDKFKEKYHQYLEEVLYVLNNKLMIPDLSIIDGKVGMEGYGPVSGDAIESGFILVSNDPTIADVNCSRLMGFNPEKIPYLKYACKRNGILIASIEKPSFSLVRKFAFIPLWQYRVIRSKIKLTRATISLNIIGKKIVHYFFRLPSYIKERKLMPFYNYLKGQ